MDQLLETTRLGATIEREASTFNIHPDLTPSYDNSNSVNEIPPLMIEKYLKDLMAIPRQKMDNSDLLNGIDRVSRNISDCINLAESTLRKRKIHIEPEKPSPRSDRSGDIFSGFDQIDDKIAHCIKLAEETLRTGSFGKPKEVRTEPHERTEKCSP